MGAAELLRLGAAAVTWAYRWISEGDLEDVRARAWADVALDERVDIDPEVRHRAVEVLAERKFDTAPPGWEPPAHLDSARLEAARASSCRRARSRCSC